MEKNIDELTRFCKRKGFVYQGSDIYGGFAGVYDYGPNGAPLKDNIRRAWLDYYMQNWDNIVQIDSAISMVPVVWEASGHVSSFSEPLVIHLPSGKRFRVDHLLEEVGVPAYERMPKDELQKLFDENFDKLNLPSKNREEFSEIKKFNLLVESNLGSVVDDGGIYLRGETAQGIYVNFKNVLDTTTVKVPFGIMQVGKSFRNEIKPNRFLFRLREFEQMEMQYFVHPDDADAVYEEMKDKRMKFYTDVLGIDKERLRFKDHENLVFYEKVACDIEYRFDFGWGEIEGIHHRGDYDLTQHNKFSGARLEYEGYVPNVIEASCGLDRLFLVMISEFLDTEKVGDDERVVLKLPVRFASYKVAVSPLLKNKEALVDKARDVFRGLKKEIGYVLWDDNGNIGKRYRRQDEIGTPFCVVIDFDTLEDDTVTVRDRDTMEQERVKIDEILGYLSKNGL